MIRAILERLLFGALLVCFLQVPILSDHYIQYLSGYLTANQEQVNQLSRLARSNNFDSAVALIDSLLLNSDSVVRQDANNKFLLLEQNKQLISDVAELKNGHYVERLLFLVKPRQYADLQKVLSNFKPGIPLTLNDLLISIGLALLLSLLIGLPFHRRSRRTAKHYTAS